MRYESKKTAKGNIGVSYISQELADVQADQMDANNCTDCTDCTDCTGALIWRGPAATGLLSINGLKWPVSTSGAHIQIGCQQHSAEEWAAFTDAQIAQMADGALEFWQQFKPTILAMAECRRANRPRM